MNSYTKTKQFTEWLKQVRPDFEIESDYHFYKALKSTRNSEVIPGYIEVEYYEDPIVSYCNTQDVGLSVRLCPAITLESLHSILWELFDVENPEYTEIKNELNEIMTYIYRREASVRDHARLKVLKKLIMKTPEATSEKLWIEYTAGKESMWLTNPDEVLDDIMKVYNEMNR